MYTIIDLRGFIIRAYLSGVDEDGIYDVEKNETINSGQYGLETFLTKYLVDWSTKMPKDKMIFCLDGGNQLRTNIYPEYKAGRNKEWSATKSKEISTAQDLVIEALQKFGFITAIQEGMEADDLIAYLALNLAGPKVVHSVDGDLKVLSAIPEVTVVYHPPKSSPEYYTGEVEDIPAKFVTLKKSIVGDKSDNYGGVKGMGDKAWDAIVEEYGVEGLRELVKYVTTSDWDSLEADAKQLNCKLLQKLSDQHEEWQLGYTLARMYPQLINAVSGRTMNKIKWAKRLPDQAFVEDMLDNMEDDEGGADWLHELMPAFVLVTADNYREVVEQLPTILKNTTLIGWDYETYDPIKSPEMNEAYAGRGDFVDVLSSIVTGCSFALGEFCNVVYYFSTNHKNTNNITMDQMKATLEVFFASGVEMVAQNIQFEATITKTNFDLDVSYWTDTAMFAKNLWEGEPSGLKSLSKIHLDYDQQTYKEVLGDAEDMSQITGEQVLAYGCDDSIVTAHLLYFFRIQSELENSRNFIEQYDCKSLQVLVDGFIEGVPINIDLLYELADKDEIDKEAAIKLVRTELESHCSSPNEAAVNGFYKDIEPFEREKLKEKGDEDYAVKLDALKAKIHEASIYKTPATFYKDVEFKPTVTQINAVMGYLEVGKENHMPDLKDVSAKGIMSYLVEVEAIVKTTETDKFLNLLAPCVGKQLKDREGDDYVKFSEFAAQVLKANSVPVQIGTQLNFGSPVQMTHLLYAMLGLPIRLRTKMQRNSKREQLGFREGGPSTQENAMQLAIAEDCTGEHEWKAGVLKAVMVINKCNTRKGLYWKPYPLWRHPRDGKMHPQIKQSATVTHRPTGSSPNLLQVSKGDVRTIFVGGETRDGEPYVYVSIDFSGQELRIIASETEDPVMLDAYIGENPKDLHTVTACTIGKDYISKLSPSFDLNQITWDGDVIDYDFFARIRQEEPADAPVMVKLFKEVRAAAKTINFGVAYGAGPQTIARGLFIPVELAKALMDALFARFVELPKWKEMVWREAEKKGYVETVYGSRRHCWPDIISKDKALKSRMQRQVANFKIQGTAADILKVVMSQSASVFKETKAYLVGPVYDEICSRVPTSKVVEYVESMSELMAITPPGHKVPMVPEVSIGLNWGEQKELGAFPSEAKINKVLEGL